MVEIEYKGANSVILTTKKIKLITDPKLSIVGLKDLPVNNAVELITEERFAVKDVETELVIHSPGEYGLEDFDIKGIAARRRIDDERQGLQSIIYRIEADNIRIGLLGNIDEGLSEEQLDSLGVLDVLIVPVGGNGYTIDAVDAAKLVRDIAPKIIIPVHYADKGLNYEVPQDDIELFVKEMGLEVAETTNKLKIKQVPLESDQTKIIKLERS